MNTTPDIDKCVRSLRNNGFEVLVVESLDQAVAYVWGEVERIAPGMIAAGDSITVKSSGLLERLSADTRWQYIDCLNPNYTFEEKMAVRRRALACDLFVTGVNAITLEGDMMWLDMIGNRIAPVVFGPKDVFILAGWNKIVEDQAAARARIKEVAAPLNAIRHPHFTTPCQKLKRCCDCSAPDRICNAWLILEKCFPVKRIKIVLVKEELGF